MAKTTDTIPIWLGSRTNKKQGIVAIPAEATAEKPGLLFLEAVDGSGVLQDGLYLWARSDDTLAYSTSAPTDEDVSGTTLGATVASAVTATSAFGTDNQILKSDLTARLAQHSGITCDDSNNLSGIGTVGCGTITIANGSNLVMQEEITFGGATTENKVEFPDSLADALNFHNASDTSYLKFKSSATASVQVGVALTLNSLGAASSDLDKFLVSNSGVVEYRTGSQVLSDIDGAGSGSNSDITGMSGLTGAIATPTNITMTGNISGVVNIASMTGSIATPTDITMSGALATPTTITASSYITTSGDVRITSDTNQLELGADAGDSSIKFDGTNLTFTDSAAGSYTLNELAASGGINPIIAGDLTLTDGSITITDMDNATSFSITNDTVTTGAPFFLIDSNSLTTESMLKIDAAAITGDGEFILCYRGGDQFAVKRYGEVEIAGNAGSNMLTITNGDVLLSNGSITLTDDDNASALVVNNNTITTNTTPVALISSTSLTDGVLFRLDADGLDANAGSYFDVDDSGSSMFSIKTKGATVIAGNDGGTASLTQTKGDHIISDGCIEVDADSTIDSHIKRGATGSSTPVLTIENTHATGTGYALLVTQAAASGASGGISITNKGTSPVLSVAAGAARTGYGIHVPGANQLAEQLILVDGALTAASDEGSITVASTGVLAAGGNLLRISSTANNAQNSYMAEIAKTAGTLAGATDGFCLQIDDDSTAVGTSYAVNIDSNANEALKVTAGKVSFAEQLTVASGGVAVTGNSTFADRITITTTDNDGVDALVVDQNDVTQDKDCLVLTTTGDGYGIKMTTETTTGKGAYFLAANNQTTSNMVLDGVTNDWVGADDVGMLHIKSDATLADAGATLLYVTTSSIKTGAEGGLARFLVTGTPQTNAHAVEIEVPATQPALASNGIVTITGQDSPGAYLVQITANDDTGNKGALDIHASGTDAAVLITGDEVDTPGLKIAAKASQTHSMMQIDGETTDWIGNADNVGMVQITHGTTALAHNGGTMLYVASSAQQKSGAEGTLARFLCTGAAQAGAAAVEISTNAADDALHVSSGIAKFSGTCECAADLSVGTTSSFTGAATFTAGQQSSAVAKTASTSGVATPAGTTFVDVTSNNAAHIVDLPTPVLGNVVYYMENTSAGYELAPQANTQFINNTACTGTKSLAVAAASLVVAVCIVGGANGKWYVGYIGNDGNWNAGGTPN